ncbi:MAG TPA: IPT/TIG domain-containing protein, partial [Candidatus Dormibacteraeota bacterium]|nr:IPT/TIG domain-containing protein [Candidatus Dormibacteraeota bacterium]
MPALLALVVWIGAQVPTRVVDAASSAAAIQAETTSAGPVSYSYDQDGRVVTVTSATAGSAVYKYDLVGNVTGINWVAAGTVSIIKFFPASGLPGARVTIDGTSFGSTPSTNVVKFNGVNATVVSATSATLVVTVPVGASGGHLSVTAGGNTVVSSGSFTVIGTGPPTITSVAPAVAVQGSPITITGTNFLASSVTANNVTINGIEAQVTAATSTSLTVNVPTIVGSGVVQVETQYGKASTPIVVTPPGIQARTVDQTVRGQIGAAPASLSVTNSGDVSLFVFNANQNDKVAFNLGWSGCCVTFTLYDPTGAVIWNANPQFVDGVRLTRTGTYTVMVSGGTGTATIAAILVPADALGKLTLGGPQVSISNTVESQNMRLTFSATKGEHLAMNLGWTNSSGQCCPGFYLEAPGWVGGNPNLAAFLVWGRGGTGYIDSESISTLPATGTYSLYVDPSYDSLGTATALIWAVPPDVSGTLTIGGPQASITNQVESQNMYLTFSGTQGQRIAMNLGWTNNSGQCCPQMYLEPPGWVDGSQTNPMYIWRGGTGYVDTESVPVLPSTGTYTLIVDPFNDSLGTATALIWAVPPDVSGTVTIGGPQASIANQVESQNMYLTFSGTQGQRIAMNLGWTNNSGQCCPQMYLEPP